MNQNKILRSIGLVAMIYLFFCISLSRASLSRIEVPEAHSTIQEAINAASPGDLIQISPGTYREHVVINKTVSLTSTIPGATIVDGNLVGNVVTISVGNVVINGLTIQNSGEQDKAGIYISSSNNVSVLNSIISNCGIGIKLDKSSYNRIEGNKIVHNSLGIRIWYDSLDNIIYGNMIVNNGDGVHLSIFSSNSNLSRNIIVNNSVGISLSNSDNNIIYENNITQNTMYGIYLSDRLSVSNIVFHNNLVENRYGIYIWISKNNADNIFYGNNFINNTVQVRIEPPYPLNIWDLAYPIGGNYWSDYRGKDELGGEYQNVTGTDGFGDTPYTVNKNNIDQYPLMQPFVLPVKKEEISYTALILAFLAIVLVGGSIIALTLSSQRKFRKREEEAPFLTQQG